MTTLNYGGAPGEDVEPGNRADLADALVTSAGLHPTPPEPMRPKYPTPIPWRTPPRLLHMVMYGVGVAAAVFVGLALFAVALVWSYALTLFMQLTLMILGGLLVIAGTSAAARSPWRGSELCSSTSTAP